MMNRDGETSPLMHEVVSCPGKDQCVRGKGPGVTVGSTPAGRAVNVRILDLSVGKFPAPKSPAARSPFLCDNLATPLQLLRAKINSSDQKSAVLNPATKLIRKNSGEVEKPGACELVVQNIVKKPARYQRDVLEDT